MVSPYLEYQCHFSVSCLPRYNPTPYQISALTLIEMSLSAAG